MSTFYKYIISRGKEMENIKIKYHNKNIDKVAAIQNGDWIDLRAAETVDMKAGEFRLISLGISM